MSDLSLFLDLSSLESSILDRLPFEFSVLPIRLEASGSQYLLSRLTAFTSPMADFANCMGSRFPRGLVLLL